MKTVRVCIAMGGFSLYSMNMIIKDQILFLYENCWIYWINLNTLHFCVHCSIELLYVSVSHVIDVHNPVTACFPPFDLLIVLKTIIH